VAGHPVSGRTRDMNMGQNYSHGGLNSGVYRKKSGLLEGIKVN